MDKIEEIKDIEGAEHLFHAHGDRFLGWYSSKVFKKKETLPLNYSDKNLNYDFSISTYNYRFIMPPVIKFIGGLITYSLGERELGVFRFPIDEKGDFLSPIHLELKDLNKELSKEEFSRILSMKSPVVFNAFKIPQYEFVFIDISDEDFQAVANITDRPFSEQLKVERGRLFNGVVNDVLERIKSSCNYLLILQNILDKKLTDFSEVSKMTNQIISI
jgi:hypothetical protein